MHQRGLVLEQTRHRQAFLVHPVYKLLNRGSRMHAFGAEARKLDLLLGKILLRILTMRHRGESVGRFFRNIAAPL